MAMVSQRDQGTDVLYNTIAVACQTLVYGIYVVLMPISVTILKHKHTMPHFKVLLSVLFFMFTLSTLYWISTLYFLLARIDSFFIHPDPVRAQAVVNWASLPNAFIYINYVLTDGVVLWRAWVLCKDASRRVLQGALVLYACTILLVCGTIGLRIGLIAVETRGVVVTRASPATHAIDTTQVATLGITLITNALATGVIASKAWSHRRMVRVSVLSAPDRRTRVERVLGLLTESGLLYILSSITVLTATVIRLPWGTLGDIYTPVNVQIAGIYPTVVIVLVSLQRGIDFAGGPNPSSVLAPFSATGSTPVNVTLSRSRSPEAMPKPVAWEV